LNRLKVAVTTLGCKSNQCDSFFIQNYLSKHNFEIVSDRSIADIYIINTCTVTAKSDFQSRQEIRRALKINSNARVYVTGCYAVTGEKSISSIKGVTGVIPPEKLKEFLLNISNSKETLRDSELFPDNNIPFVEKFPGRTRAFFKIQDGCDYRCSYCIVPFARGRSRSKALNEVIQGLKKYKDLGYKEVILTGVHLGSYGHDLFPRLTFVDLLEKITREIDGIRIRLSSLDPHEINDRVVKIVADSQIFCRHFHIPLQSGDDTILKRMRRNYRVKDFVSVISTIKNLIPEAAVGIDVIAGFPGEGEDEFNNTYKLIESLPVTYLHVFPFSVRRGTLAASLPDKVHGRIIKERVERLIQLGKKKKHEFYSKFIGKRVDVLVEGKQKDGHFRGFTDNYLPVRIEGNGCNKGEIVHVIITKENNLTLIGSTSE